MQILHDGYLGTQSSFFKVSPGPAAPVTRWGLGDTPVKTIGQEGAFGVAYTSVKLLEDVQKVTQLRASVFFKPGNGWDFQQLHQ